MNGAETTTRTSTSQDFFIRPSAFRELFDCPARFEAKHLRGLRLPTSSAALLGTAIHRGSAVFDQSRIDNGGLTAEDAAGAVVDAIHHPEDDILWEDETPQSIEKAALPLHALYCSELSPAHDWIGVEVETARLHIEDLGITIGGTTDRVYVTEDGALGIADIKTGKAAVSADGAVKTAGFAPQLGLYEMLAQYELQRPIEAPALILGLTTAKTAKGRRAGVGAVPNAREILFGDEYTPGMLEMASRLLRSGNFYGNPASTLCSAKYCPAYQQCKYHA